MSNRLIGILILFGFVIFGFVYYYYFFVYNLVTLTIKSNIAGYTVELKNLKLSKKVECPYSLCIIKDLSLFEYELELKKESYTTINNKLVLSSDTSIDVNFEKEVIFEKVDEVANNIYNTGMIISTGTILKKTREEIISDIKKNQDVYKLISINNDNFIFKTNLDKLELFLNDKSIGLFPYTTKNNISILEVSSSIEYFLLILGNKKYIINTTSNSIKEINLSLDIIYLKVGYDEKSFQLITKEGTFIYNLRNNELNYYSKYSDFVYLEGKVLALVKKNDIIRKKNIGFSDKESELLVLFDNETKETILLKELSFDVFKIIYENKEVFVYDIEGNKYKIDNF